MRDRLLRVSVLSSATLCACEDESAARGDLADTGTRGSQDSERKACQHVGCSDTASVHEPQHLYSIKFDGFDYSTSRVSLCCRSQELVCACWARTVCIREGCPQDAAPGSCSPLSRRARLLSPSPERPPFLPYERRPNPFAQFREESPPYSPMESYDPSE